MLEQKVDIPAACEIQVPFEIKESTEGRIGRFLASRRGDDTRSIPDGVYIGDLTLKKLKIFKQELKKIIL